jgi:O-methyltransferase
MRGVLEALGDRSRRVWVADSFEGLPVPDAERYTADDGLDWSHVEALKVSSDDVRANFERYGLLDDRVQFLEGWFCDTLPDAPIEQLSVLRLDGDLYQSTMDALEALEPKVSPGGFVIVDDHGGWEPCRQAVTDYRDANGITAPIHEVDWTGVWWRAG